MKEKKRRQTLMLIPLKGSLQDKTGKENDG